MDQHYDGEALRFLDFLRLAKRLTERRTEEDLGVVRASLRLKRREDEAARADLGGFHGFSRRCGGGGVGEAQPPPHEPCRQLVL